MAEHVNNVFCVLGVAFVLANVCIWSSFAEDDMKRVKYEYEVNKGVPHIVMARRTPEDDAPIVFVQDEHHTNGVKNDGGKYANQSKPIPLDLIYRINDIENFSDLQNLFENYDADIRNRFGADEDVDNIDRKGAVMPKPASCIPELVTVPLQNSEDKSVFYYPSCTRVERCGGCCSHELLSCQPTATEMVNFQVIVSRYEGGSKLKYKGKEIVTVEQHTKCKCDCKIKESDCNSLQEYNQNDCRCVCLNVDEEQKCIQENYTKLWDPNECICGCREVKECSTGLYFDQKTCSCVQVPIIRRRVYNDAEIRYRRGESDPNKYIYIPRPVVPLKKTNENNPEDL